jgi:hypothetical protein
MSGDDAAGGERIGQGGAGGQIELDTVDVAGRRAVDDFHPHGRQRSP